MLGEQNQVVMAEGQAAEPSQLRELPPLSIAVSGLENLAKLRLKVGKHIADTGTSKDDIGGVALPRDSTVTPPP
jgi:hypothetical protein